MYNKSFILFSCLFLLVGTQLDFERITVQPDKTSRQYSALMKDFKWFCLLFKKKCLRIHCEVRIRFRVTLKKTINWTIKKQSSQGSSEHINYYLLLIITCITCGDTFYLVLPHLLPIQAHHLCVTNIHLIPYIFKSLWSLMWYVMSVDGQVAFLK